MTTILITLVLIVLYFIISLTKENEARETIEMERKENNRKLTELKDSLKVSNKKPEIEIYVKDEILVKIDPIRYMTGYPGENSRVLTKSYYTLFYSSKKDRVTALEFLKYRCDTFNAIVGVSLDNNIIDEVANTYCDSVAKLIFFISFRESQYGNSEIFNENVVRKVYNVILEEHNKVCPFGQEELNDFDVHLLSDIIKICSRQ